MKRTPLARTKPIRRDTALSSASRTRPRAERLAGAKPAGNPIPQASRDLVHHRSGGHCEIRGADDCAFTATDLHHRKRRRDGGHAASNLLDACAPCHRNAHAHPQLARERGWIVSAFAVDPALEPVSYGDPEQQRTWFHDDGTKTTAFINTREARPCAPHQS